jgi:hypothetical protein
MPLFGRIACALLASKVFLGVSASEGVSSRLQVHIPKSLFRQDGYDHREALFGIPPYGGKITQNVYYADSELCDSNVDTRAGYPIRPQDDTGEMMPWPSPYILMMDRGGCTFVTKVRNAQRSGAAGVIIADNSCLCSAGDQCFSEPGVDCEQREPIMADDGSGTDITIPAFLMFKQDSDLLKAELRANTMVQLEMAWSLPSPDDRVEYDLWTMPTDLVSRDFLRTFKDASMALGDRAYFTPHMYIYDGVKSNCHGMDGENQCYNLCTNAGRYCATDPDNDLDKGISGADVVIESLRRICIWKHYGEEDGVGAEWWDYTNEFMMHCDTPDFFTDDSCIEDIMSTSGIDVNVINQCMEDSGGVDDDDENTLLDAELLAKENVGVVILPATYVNRAAIRGALELPTMFRAICSGYAVGTEPDICLTCVPCADQKGCIAQGVCHGAKSADSVSQTSFLGSLLGLSAFFGLIIFIQYTRTQRKIRDQVRGIVAEYMPLDENAADLDTEIS